MGVNFIAGRAGSAEGEDWQPEDLRRRLSNLAQADLDTAARTLIEELVRFNRVPPNRRHIPVVDIFRALIESVMPRLQARLDGSTPPISRSVRANAYLVEKLLKELGIAYTRLVHSVPVSWLSFGHRQQLHGPLVRAMDLLARRLLLSYRLYARAPKGVWAGLHELHLLALDWNIANRDIAAPNTSAYAVYRKALLLAFAEPSRLASGDLQRVRDYIARFGDAADVVRPHADRAVHCLFIIDSREDRAGLSFAKLRHPVPSDRALLLETGRLVDRIGQQLQQLEQGIAPVQLGLPQDPDTQRYRNMLRRLAANWSGAARKRAPRLHFRPRAEVHVGFPGVWKMLEAPVEPGPAAELPANEWGILNESPGGFALRHIRGAIPALRVGDLIGVRSRDRGDVFVCLVRWILSETAEHIDIGLQQLAPRFAPATYRRIDGRAVTHVPVLFAPSSPHFNRVPVVVLPAKLVTAGTDFVIQYLGGAITLRAERALESTPHAELFQVSAR